MKKIISLVLVVVMVLSLSACGSKEKVIEIGNKNYTEARVLGQMFALVVEDSTDYKVNVTEFGGTNVVLEALKAGEVDLYPEYTGTAYGAILGQSELKDPQKVYDYVKKAYLDDYNIVWGKQLGYNNTYTFALRPEVAEKYGIKTYSELAEIAGDLKFISTAEFVEREDGLLGIKKVYGGFEFADIKTMDPGLRYTAIAQGEGDLMDAFSTDGKLIEYNLTILEDDKNFFPPYYVAPIFNGDFAKEYPEVVEALAKLENVADEATMQQLNYQVDTMGRNERDVVREFLQSKGIID